MRPTEPAAPAPHIAPALKLLVARGDDGASQWIGHGTAGRIGIADPAARARFVELAAIGPRPEPAVLTTGGRQWTFDFGLKPHAVAVVNAGSAVGGRRVRDCLELAAATAGRDERAVAMCLADHGMVALADVPLHALRLHQHVQVQFLQAWLREPEWLLFDGVFDAPGSAGLSHLPQRFADRFPMRAMSILGRCMPPVQGMTPAPTLDL